MERNIKNLSQFKNYLKQNIGNKIWVTNANHFFTNSSNIEREISKVQSESFVTSYKDKNEKKEVWSEFSKASYWTFENDYAFIQYPKNEGGGAIFYFYEDTKKEDIENIITEYVFTAIFDSKNLEEIDVSKFTNLETLSVSGNQLTELDLSNNPNLARLSCNDNQLIKLDLSNNPKLEEFGCKSNQLTELDLSNNPDLHYLNLANNQLTELDLSNNPKLEHLWCYNNQLIELDLSNNPDLEELHCRNNPNLKKVFISSNVKELFYSKYASWRLTKDDHTEIIVKDKNTDNATEPKKQINYGITYLDVSSKELKTLDLSVYPDLFGLDCSHNKLTELDLSNNPKLQNVYCRDNYLSKINLKNNINLENLDCYDNQLTELDVSQNKKLVNLRCTDNQLTKIDLKNNLELQSFDCNNNQLTELDLSNNLKLKNLELEKNNLSFLNLSKNKKLSHVRATKNPNLSRIFTPDIKKYVQVIADDETLVSSEFSNEQKNMFEGYSKNENGKFELIDKKNISFEIDNVAKFVMEGKNEKALYLNTFTFKNLEEIHCARTLLKTIDITKNPKITKIVCIDNTDLTEIKITPEQNKKIENNQLEVIKDKHTNFFIVVSDKKEAIEVASEIKVLDVSNQNLTKLDLNKYSNLVTLYCHDNKLTELDLSNNPKLETVVAGGRNNIKEIFITQEQFINIRKKDFFIYIKNNPKYTIKEPNKQQSSVVPDKTTETSIPKTTPTKEEKIKLLQDKIINLNKLLAIQQAKKETEKTLENIKLLQDKMINLNNLLAIQKSKK